MKMRISSLLVGILAAGVLAGCNRPFTREHFDIIQVGVDDKSDVREILGNPKSDLKDQWLYDDLKRHYSAIIHFNAEDRVTGKEWMDEKTGAWEGRNPNANEPPQGEVRERSSKTTRIKKD